MKSKTAFIQRKVSPHGGGEMFALRFIDEMTKLGHQITLLAHSIHPSLLQRFAFVRIPVLKPFSFLKMLSFAWGCRRAAQKNRFDLIFSNERTLYHDIYFAGEGCHRFWLQQRFRQVTAFKKFLIRINPLHWTLMHLEKRCLTNPRLKGVVAFSNRTKEELIAEHGIAGDKIKVVYHGVPDPVAGDADRETLRKDMGIADDELVILFLGSGFERKGLKFLIEALKGFDHPHFRLLVVGKGRTGKYKRLAKKLGVENKVHFYGQNPNAPLFYMMADMFILPTLYEPFGLVVLEAMSYGVAVAVSRCAGASELISDKENGLIIRDPFDPAEIGRCLEQLKNPALRRSLAEEGLKLSRTYTLEKNSRGTLLAVTEFLEKS